MRTKTELGRRNLIDLAVLCGAVADSPSPDSATAEKAWKLKREWVLLVAKETPPPRSRKEHRQIEAEKESLKERMAEFLSARL